MFKTMYVADCPTGGYNSLTAVQEGALPWQWQVLLWCRIAELDADRAPVGIHRIQSGAAGGPPAALRYHRGPSVRQAEAKVLVFSPRLIVKPMP